MLYIVRMDFISKKSAEQEPPITLFLMLLLKKDISSAVSKRSKYYVSQQGCSEVSDQFREILQRLLSSQEFLGMRNLEELNTTYIVP